jgi:iron complex transport system substrate-binding protein
MLRKLSIVVITALLLTVGLVQAQDATETVCEAGFHLFSHKLLATDPVCIPDNAKKIVALDNSAVELLLFTDKEIIGTFDAFTKDELSASLPALAPKLAPITGIGWPANLELILSLKPDLIAVYNNETMPYDQLSKIAPTVVFNAGIAEGNWQTATEFWSEVFGVQDIYQNMLDTYNARVAELQAALGENRAERKVSLVLASSYFNLIYTADNPTSRILADVGLGRPEAQALDSAASLAKYENATYAYLSDETLNLADGDDIFVFTFPVLGDAVSASDEYLKTFESNPLWQSLSAVKSGHVYAASYAWSRGNTYLLANAVLDDLFKYLAQTEPTIPDPIQAFAAEATPEVTPAS